jgi:hypothetical protein
MIRSVKEVDEVEKVMKKRVKPTWEPATACDRVTRQQGCETFLRSGGGDEQADGRRRKERGKRCRRKE